MLLAHSANSQGLSHALADHLTSVAEQASKYSSLFGCSRLGYLAGAWHDAGKVQASFQKCLAASDNLVVQRAALKVPHSPVGAVAMMNSAPLVAALIAGHHGGLHSLADLKGKLSSWASDPRVKEAARNAEQLLAEHRVDCQQVDAELAALGKRDVFEQELVLRLLFSALVDADWTDTSAHFHPETSSLRSSDVGLCALAEEYSSYMKQLERACLQDDSASDINLIRAEVRQQCILAGSMQQGVFRLTVPTGGGKTLASLGFALAHALHHGLHRIIFAIPYTSIVEQTAGAYREVFAKDQRAREAILEHHSALGAERSNANDIRDSVADDEYQERQRLSCENWDAPLIVTTTVQLFDSLFANRPAPCRKLHNIARSVIIIDETQTLPVGLLRPCISMLEGLVRLAGSSVVLCTATQPALEGQNSWLAGFSSDVLRGEIVPEPERYFVVLKRVKYELPPEPWDWHTLAKEILATPRCLVVLNTRKDALALVRVLRESGDLGEMGVLHLSTLLCAAHRSEVLAAVRRRLRTDCDEPCRLVSTQVVEAGVDLDFPVVFRAIGPLDRIVQAAGRCNREGKLVSAHGQPALGLVVIFEPAEGTVPPGEYRSGTFEARKMLFTEGVDLHDPQVYRRYFSLLYQDASTDKEQIQASRAAFDYPEVARKGHLIKDESEPVIVRYPEEVVGAALDQLASKLRAGYVLQRQDWRQLQQHVVNLRSSEIKKYQAFLNLEQVPGLTVWTGQYDPLIGIGGGDVDLAQMTD